jgi:flagellar basal-body rod modification protein FlgD
MATPVTNNNSINNVINVNQPTASNNATGSDLSAGDFLTLLTTELANQDPTQPMDDTQSVTQLAQFSALQSQEQMTSDFASFQSNFGVMQSASLIGQTVTAQVTNSSGNSDTTTGTVTSISVQNGQPYFTMKDSNGNPITDNNGNPLLFSTSEIIGIGTSASSSSNTGSGTGG